MFELIRSHRRWMQVILLILIVPSFFLVGIQGYDSFMSSEPELASVGDQPITQGEFDIALRNQLEQYRQTLGSRYDPAMLDTPAMREQLLNDLIDRRLLAQVAQAERFSVSDTTLRDTIASIPAVQDNGRFSAERYRQVLAAQGMTPAQFEAGLRGDLAINLVLQPVIQSGLAPAEVVASLESALTQERTIQLRRFPAADYRAQVSVTPEEIKAWYDSHQQELTIPEQVTAQYLVLDEPAASKDVQVSDADIAGYYDQNKSRFGQPERRRASHILIQVPANASDSDRQAARAKAESLAQQAAANPAEFDKLAKENSQDAGSAQQGGDLGWLGAGMLTGSLGEAVFSLNKDQISGVIESPSGYHVFKVTEIQPAATKPLAEVRDQIVAEIRKQIAANRFAEMATKLTEIVYDQRDSLQPAADALGLKTRTASGITRKGLLSADDTTGESPASAGEDAALLDNPRVREALFSPESLREKLNSGVIELSSDKLLVVRVENVEPQHVAPLEKAEATIRERLIEERAAEAARKAGEDALKTWSADAASLPEGFGESIVVSRQQASQLPPSVLQTAMRLPAQKLPAYAGVEEGNDFVVIRLDKVEPGKTDASANELLARQLGSTWGEAEAAAVLKQLREQYKVQILPAAQQAIQGAESSENAG
ncbi:SurA N-terminal domain-containing protein [Bordetella sp. 02P26C-1]|uniref:SurA N-terminal domain-containing protein n=1 Tax=Bordetella sp. 02P26C-1 TaxID=2683195 RepID=UPI001355F94F|nr:SurA N-terminal domain-containing protein [Bordetella sp. 02P26C-1]MVW80593.1 peptidylprolyl isomerase [Bordetella sp. 02P26C-1]